MHKFSTAMLVEMFVILIVHNVVIVVFLERFSKWSDSNTTNTF